MQSLIINADDFGRSPVFTDAILDAFKQGLIHRTTIMVNMPDCHRAVELATNFSILDKVGLHLNLTEGEPLTEIYKKQERLMENNHMSGHNFFTISRGRGFTASEIFAIRCEIIAQIEKYKALGFSLNHIDSHHHVHLEKDVLKILFKVAHDFESMRIGRNLMSNDVYSQLKLIYKFFVNRSIKLRYKHTEKMGSYDDYVNYYKNGSLEIMVHPVYYNGILCDRISESEYIPLTSYVYEK